MRLFLTSNLGNTEWIDGKKIPCPMENPNGLRENIRKYLTDKSRCLIICSDPNDIAGNDEMLRLKTESFHLSGWPLQAVDLCDSRNAEQLPQLLQAYDLLILAGGHVPTENRFFTKIRLKDLLQDYTGTVIGISAGSMNSAALVYAQPELEGEAIDPTYERWIAGLGLTQISILPHFQELRHLTLDGLRILEDISLPDSKEHPYYALTDGSYILEEGGSATLYGEAYYLANGIMQQICSHNQSVKLF